MQLENSAFVSHAIAKNRKANNAMSFLFLEAKSTKKIPKRESKRETIKIMFVLKVFVLLEIPDFQLRVQ